MTFDEYWATTGDWPDNILSTAFKEVAEKAWFAGRRSLGIEDGLSDALDRLAEAIANPSARSRSKPGRSR